MAVIPPALRSLGVPLLVALLPLLVLAPAIWNSEVLIPGSILLADVPPWRGPLPAGVEPCRYPQSDLTSQYYPWQTLTLDALSRGRLPLWNPYSYCGAPLLANSQSAPLFPTRLFDLALPPAPASQAAAFLRLLVAALGAYGFARTLELQRGPAAFAAAAFSFCGFTLVWLEYSVANVAVFLPLLFLLAERVIRAPSGRRAAALGLAIGVQFLGGHPETSFHVLLATGAWAIYRLAGEWRAERRFEGTGRRAAWLAVACGVGLALAAAALLPLVEYMRESSALFARTAKNDAGRDASHPLAPVSIVGLVFPEFLGTESSGPRSVGLRPSNNFNELAGGYVGLAALVAGLSFFAAPKRRGPLRFFAILSLVCLPLIYRLGPTNEWLSSLPLLSLSANRRFLLVVAFANAMLGGCGLARLLGPDERAARRTAAAAALLSALLGVALFAVHSWEKRHPGVSPGYETTLAAAAAGLVLFGALAIAQLVGRAPRPAAASAIALAALLVDVVAFGAPIHRGVQERHLYPDVPPLPFLREATKDGSRISQEGTVLRPETAVVPRLRSIKGYDALEIRRYTELLAPLSANPKRSEAFVKNVATLERLDSPILDLLAVKFVLTPAPLDPVPRGLTLREESGGVLIYENVDALPRAFVVTGRRIVADPKARRRALADPAFDPRTTVILEDAAAGGSDEEGDASGWPARIVVDEAERVVIEADGGAREGGATLVLADAFFPGWRASVDGRDTPIWRADHALRAVALPPGAQRVEFQFEPLSVRVGLAVSAAAALATIALIALARGAGGPPPPRREG